ncbi:MAG: hypothetical protein KIT32_04250 [Rhodocyclaceae bacterium]|nr:hypothetical protein [Rhodocyclaceae bacterium]
MPFDRIDETEVANAKHVGCVVADRHRIVGTVRCVIHRLDLDSDAEGHQITSAVGTENANREIAVEIRQTRQVDRDGVGIGLDQEAPGRCRDVVTAAVLNINLKDERTAACGTAGLLDQILQIERLARILTNGNAG